MDMVRHIK
jgi:aldehyde dehydrogenase (NAD+)